MNQPASTPALPPVALAALRAAVSAACESISASSPDSLFGHADGFWEPITDVVNAEVSAWVRRHNDAHSSGNRLPAELFQMVLAPLNFADRLSVARVCTTWKNRSASCSVIPLDQFDSVTAAEARSLNAQLNLLGSPRVHLHILLETMTIELLPSAKFVRRHLPHTVKLQLVIHGDSYTRSERDAFVKLLSTSAPLLQTLSVAFNGSAKLERLLTHSAWFGDSAPGLRRCRFYRAVFYQPIFSLVSIAFFLVETRSQFEQLSGVLSRLAHLEELCVAIDDSLGPSLSPLTPPPGLRRLWLEDLAAEHLDDIDFTDVPNVIVQSDTRQLGCVHRLVHQPVKTLDIYPHLTHSGVMVRIQESPQRTRVLNVDMRLADKVVNDLLFGHVTTLSLHDPHLLGNFGMPAMPALSYLTVYLPGPLAALHDALQPWALPRIRRLELIFTCYPCTSHRTCPAGDITKFVTHTLGAEIRYIGLVIRGTAVLEPGFAELSARVASLYVESHIRVPNSAPVWVRAADFENVWNGEVTLRDAM
ncbi:hypothetical protein EXIGLDRAFT_845677 [Exidia glandulosa HHB12029]|uniref:F-box domain-containing protein n=1 Tax=Exidia glandulosa HHB12029 TaxID=1314781 RepID=A0A165BC56_EXIGL|nr:hypothetical protein EXIGLDRAFT_845677 [Exidia glandulosa HHB12029]